MKIIEINALENGAHRNQAGTFSAVPKGWAVIPDDMTIPDSFPFVNIEVEDQVVTAITEGVVPDVEPAPDPVDETVTWDSMAAAITEGVNEV